MTFGRDFNIESLKPVSSTADLFRKMQAMNGDVYSRHYIEAFVYAMSYMADMVSGPETDESRYQKAYDYLVWWIHREKLYYGNKMVCDCMRQHINNCIQLYKDMDGKVTYENGGKWTKEVAETY
jgi:hypothetical protein